MVICKCRRRGYYPDRLPVSLGAPVRNGPGGLPGCRELLEIRAQSISADLHPQRPVLHVPALLPLWPLAWAPFPVTQWLLWAASLTAATGAVVLVLRDTGAPVTRRLVC